MTTARDLLSRHRLALPLLAALVLALTAALLATQLDRRGGADPAATRPTAGATATEAAPRTAAPVSARHLSSQDRAALRRALSWLRSMPTVEAGTSRSYRPIDGQPARQADLYAAAFTRTLLTQDYRRPRTELLAWVQAESAPSSEPTVVGLIPRELRGRLAVASVQEGFDGPGPVPAPGVWDTLAGVRGHTSVVIQRVIEPVAWSTAVANGTVTDPGVTAREVDAQVTLHTRDHGHAKTQRYSVAVTMNLEGPPARDGYGLVMVVDYKAIEVGGS